MLDIFILGYILYVINNKSVRLSIENSFDWKEVCVKKMWKLWDIIFLIGFVIVLGLFYISYDNF